MLKVSLRKIEEYLMKTNSHVNVNMTILSLTTNSLNTKNKPCDNSAD